ALGKDGWVIYDGIVKVEHGLIHDGESYEAATEGDDFTDRPVSDGLDDMIRFVNVAFGNGFRRRILARCPVYILNNDGKTVERV
ncbi:MAG TPA: hypothetical protein PKJ72_14450, partial [Deltaproteobacteria bacterium]|nr:hypothetical protein [Deltaproteobacteria bacterium]